MDTSIVDQQQTETELSVIEFKLSPHNEAVKAWEYQLNELKTVWNSALALRIEADDRYWIKRLNLDAVCPSTALKRKGNKKQGKGQSPTQWRTIASGVVRPEKTKPIRARGAKTGIIAGPYCRVRKLQGVEPLDKQIIDADGNKITSALSRTQAISNYPWLDSSLVDSRYIAGVYRTLDQAWKAYKKGVRNRPKFKGKKDKLKSLANYSGSVRFERIGGGPNGWVNFPKLKPVKCKGLYKRYDDRMKTGTVKLCKKGGNWYLQLTRKDVPFNRLSDSDKAIGIDLGVKQNATTSEGKVYHCKQSKRIQQRIERLQRKAARQYRMNADEKHPTGRSTLGHQRTIGEISRLQDKQKRSRHAWQHKTSTKILKSNGVIVFEDLKLQNMTKRPKPKSDEKGGYAKNGAKAKAGLNRVILKSGLGGLRSKVESKGDRNNRTVIRVNPAYTSATCSNCGHRHTKEEKASYRPTQSQFICQKCGHTDNADINAAENILVSGLTMLDTV